jgi:anti-sigma-K factor RskA
VNYAKPRLRQMLAAEYALGTLHGRARRRFETLLLADPSLRAELTFWEAQFAGLQRGFKPQAPRDLVWAAIDRQINAPRATPLPVRSASPGLWRPLAIAASLASVALSLALVREMQRPPEVIRETVRVEVPQPMPYVAMLQPASSDSRVTVALMPDKHLMKVALTGKFDTDYARQCLELWVIDDAGKPHSLGVLPEEGEMQMPMPDMPMPKKPTLAVSVEPKGGSPTGLPTGPVISTGRALRT